MAGMKILSETSMNIYQLRKELENIKKRDNELNLRASRTEDYLNQTATLNNSEELFDKILKLEVPRLREQHINKIMDIAPTNVNDLKVILQGYTISLSNESIKKIIDTINEFLEKNKT